MGIRKDHEVFLKIRQASPEEQDKLICGNVELINDYLKIGMSKDDVFKLLGLPHNINSSNIWIWAGDYDKNKQLTWENLILTSSTGAYYLIFIDDKLVNRMFPSSMHPIGLLAGKMKISYEEAARILDTDLNEYYALCKKCFDLNSSPSFPNPAPPTPEKQKE